MRNLLILALISLTITGCKSNPDLQQLARASCALTMDCYAPGVAPGTNPYNTSSAPAVADTRSVNQRKTPQVTFPVQWNEICPMRYGNLSYIKHVKVQGRKICQYG